MLDTITTERIKSFYMGRLYPILACMLVGIGEIFAVEHVTIPINVFVACGILIFCDSIKPVITMLCVFLYSLSGKNAVFGASASDYYTTGWRIVLLYIMIVTVAVSLICFVYRNGILRKIFTRKTPQGITLLLLTLVFLSNGIFSGQWVKGNLLFGFFQVISYVLIFVLFYHGFSDKESAEELADYYAYVMTLIALLLLCELGAVYAMNGVVLDSGVIDRSKILFGWGSCNSIGIISIFIPMIFYASYRSKYFSFVYFVIATATYVGAILTISRNALLFGSIVYVLCLVFLSIFGEKKSFFRACLLLVVFSSVIIAFNYNDIIMVAFKSYIDRGFDDSSRIDIWVVAWRAFLESPLFGNGFRGFLDIAPETVGFIPPMAHNAFFQILFSMGLAGLAVFALHVYQNVRCFVRNFSIMKFFYGMMILTLIGMSLLDNFSFLIQPVFYTAIARAIIWKRVDEENFFVPILRESRSRW